MLRLIRIFPTNYILTDTLFSLTRRQHFYARNDVMTAILKVLHQIEIPTPSPRLLSIDAYLLEEHSCQISP